MMTPWLQLLVVSALLVFATGGDAPAPAADKPKAEGEKKPEQCSQYPNANSVPRKGADCKYPVKSFVILGERGSGTNWLSNIIKQNIQPDSAQYLHTFPKRWLLSEFNLTISQHTVFILLVRNPYDWLKSMHTSCFCCEHMEVDPKNPDKMPFEQFLQTPYRLKHVTSSSGCPSSEVAAEDLSSFSNMMRVRTHKLKMHMHLGLAFKPWFTVVRLEDLWCSNNPVLFLQHKLQDFCFKWLEKPNMDKLEMDARQWLGVKFNITHKVNQSWHFNRNRTCDMHGYEVQLINRNLNNALEKRIGYPLLNCD